MTSGVPYAEVIGDPIEHSKSPLIHNRWLTEREITADYRATRVSPADLSDYLEVRRSDPLWRGCNLTMPLKEQVGSLLDSVHRSAAAIGAVNTVRRDEHGELHGRNSDVHGVWRALDGVRLEGARAVLVGVGGAARAAAFALRRAGATELHLMARGEAKAKRLAADLFPGATWGPLEEAPPGDLLINASPLGMAGQPWPVLPLSGLAQGAMVFDMVYAPSRTALLAAAEERGLKTVGGGAMLLFQAAEAFATFFDVTAPTSGNAELLEEIAR
jgi:shikimate dehydrogenase